MPFKVFSKRFKVPIHTNIRRGRVELKGVGIEEGCGALEATRRAPLIECFPSDEASGHEGVKSGLNYCRAFYVHDKRFGGRFFSNRARGEVALQGAKRSAGGTTAIGLGGLCPRDRRYRRSA